MVFAISSTAFRHETLIVERYTCEGADVSPPLTWSDVPRDCKSLALIVEDPDAPDPAAPKQTFTHWIVYNLPPESRGLDEAVGRENMPAGAVQGRNDFGKKQWNGPCPPIGRHRYFFKLYALDTKLELGANADRKDVLEAMKEHVISEAELMGTYQKQQAARKASGA